MAPSSTIPIIFFCLPFCLTLQRLLKRETGDGASSAVDDLNEVPPSSFPLPVSKPNKRTSSSSNEEETLRPKYVNGEEEIEN